MNHRPLIEATELLTLQADPAAASALVVLHATVELPKPTADGDSPARSGQDAFERGHIPGAHHADLLVDLAREDAPFRFAQPGAEDLAGRLARLGVGAETRVVAYDDDGSVWAARLFWALRAIGHAHVQVLDGGLTAWTAAGGGLEQGPAPEPARVDPLLAAENPAAFVDVGQVKTLLKFPNFSQLVCTLPESSFDGSEPSRYARRGHIPGSVNVPSRGLVDDTGRLLPDEQLRERLAPLLEDSRPITLYCGGGISASLAALALVAVGREDVSVYDGSLEEWAADPELPLETGT